MTQFQTIRTAAIAGLAALSTSACSPSLPPLPPDYLTPGSVFAYCLSPIGKTDIRNTPDGDILMTCGAGSENPSVEKISCADPTVHPRLDDIRWEEDYTLVRAVCPRGPAVYTPIRGIFKTIEVPQQR